MSTDKYPSIFSPQMEAIGYIFVGSSVVDSMISLKMSKHDRRIHEINKI